MTLSRGDYIVGMAVTPKTRKKAKDGEQEQEANLILSVTENGYGKRTDVDEYRLTSRGGKGIINVKTTSRNGKIVSILLVDEKSEVMVISQFGKIIRINSKTVRESGRWGAGRAPPASGRRRPTGSSIGHPAGRGRRERQRRERCAGAMRNNVRGASDRAPDLFLAFFGCFNFVRLDVSAETASKHNLYSCLAASRRSASNSSTSDVPGFTFWRVRFCARRIRRCCAMIRNCSSCIGSNGLSCIFRISSA